MSLATRRTRTKRLAAGILFSFLAAACGAEPEPAPAESPGSFAFAVLGDAPYSALEEMRFRHVLAEMDGADLAWVLHVGDIFGWPCSDAHYESRLQYFQGLRHPVIYTPGDNEWTDCHGRGAGGYAPRERLARLRQVFFTEPASSLGGRSMPLISQGGSAAFPEFVENARWTHAGVIFATLHIVGSRNAMEEFDGRNKEDDEAVIRRTAAATAWLREAFSVARDTGAWAVFIAFHADPGFEAPAADPYRSAYEPFLLTLEEEVERFAGPVVVAHGDNHRLIIDQPLTRRTTGKRLENFTRLEVYGSPDVGWVRVVVTPDAAEPFRFEPHLVPAWKVW